jgi:hypothetical protein
VAGFTLAGMSDLWLPGGAAATEDFVARLQQQIARFAAAHGLAQARVEAELRDGGTLVLDAIDAEPGYGFVTLRPHPAGDDEPDELIVPLASVTRFRISSAEEEPTFGFALPGRTV